MKIQPKFQTSSPLRPINATNSKSVEPKAMANDSYHPSPMKSVQDCARDLYEKAPIVGNVVLATGIGLTSALVAAGTTLVMPAAVGVASTAMALAGGVFACYATLDDSDTIDQAVRTFVGGIAASVAGPAAAAEGLAAGFLFGGAGVAMMTQER